MLSRSPQGEKVHDICLGVARNLGFSLLSPDPKEKAPVKAAVKGPSEKAPVKAALLRLSDIVRMVPGAAKGAPIQVLRTAPPT
jgi:hypothetical protein